MPKAENSQIERWAGEIESLGKKLLAHAKAVTTASDDPFAQREQIDRIDKILNETNLQTLKAPTDLRTSINTSCIEASAEFWQRFCTAAKEAGWSVQGTTERRLLANAYFVELKNDSIVIEGHSGKLSPHVPTIIGTLKPLIHELTADKGSVQRFSDILGEAYDVFGNQSEVPIEAVFRQCVLLAQPVNFWAAVEQSKFQPFSRPMFRCLLSAILAENVRPGDGRELRLTPTVNRKDVWEVYSPAEGRVVQVGRIAFFKRSDLQ